MYEQYYACHHWRKESPDEENIGAIIERTELEEVKKNGHFILVLPVMSDTRQIDTIYFWLG